MRAAQKSPLIPVSIFVAVCVALYAGFQFFVTGATLPPLLVGGIIGFLLLAILLRRARRWIAQHPGASILTAGVGIMGGCVWWGFLLGIIAGGFLAVSGAVLMLRK